MGSISKAVVLTTALVLGFTGVARADDADTFAKIEAAQAALKSFQMTTTIAGLNAPTVATFVKPSAFKQTMSMGSMSMMMYMVDSVMYVQINGGEWQKRAFDAKAIVSQLGISLPKTPSRAIIADTIEGATTYGTLQYDIPPVSMSNGTTTPQQKMTCSFDKVTYLLHTCMIAQVSLAYGKFNDPSNVVELPAAAKNATKELTLPGLPGMSAPAPVTSPTPAPASTK